MIRTSHQVCGSGGQRDEVVREVRPPLALNMASRCLGAALPPRAAELIEDVGQRYRDTTLPGTTSSMRWRDCYRAGRLRQSTARYRWSRRIGGAAGGNGLLAWRLGDRLLDCQLAASLSRFPWSGRGFSSHAVLRNPLDAPPSPAKLVVTMAGCVPELTVMPGPPVELWLYHDDGSWTQFDLLGRQQQHFEPCSDDGVLGR